MCNPHVQPQASHPRLRCGAGVAIIPKRTVAWALSHSVDPAALAFLVPAPRVQRAAKAQKGTIRTTSVHGPMGIVRVYEVITVVPLG